jgi:hypothetical protein
MEEPTGTTWGRSVGPVVVVAAAVIVTSEVVPGVDRETLGENGKEGLGRQI